MLDWSIPCSVESSQSLYLFRKFYDPKHIRIHFYSYTTVTPLFLVAGPDLLLHPHILHYQVVVSVPLPIHRSNGPSSWHHPSTNICTYYYQWLTTHVRGPIHTVLFPFQLSGDGIILSALISGQVDHRRDCHRCYSWDHILFIYQSPYVSTA